jgi:hypothetical protein
MFKYYELFMDAYDLVMSDLLLLMVELYKCFLQA